MSKFSKEELFDLVKQLKEIAKAINDYQIENWVSLSEKEFMILNKAELDILIRVQDILAKSVIIEVENCSEILEEMSMITRKIEDDFKMIDNLNHILSISTKIVYLISALISKNPVAITDAFISLKTELRIVQV